MSPNQFEELYKQHRERLLNRMTIVMRNRDTAEDVTAAAFTAAFEHLDAYRGDSSFYTWLHAIAMNKGRLAIRRERSVSLDALPKTEPWEPLELDAIDQQALDRQDCCANLRDALRRIPPLYRQTLVDRFLRGYSVKSLSRRNGVPVGTVLSRIFKAKRLLRKAWEA